MPVVSLSESLAVELTEINLALLLPRLPYKPHVLDGEYYVIQIIIAVFLQLNQNRIFWIRLLDRVRLHTLILIS